MIHTRLTWRFPHLLAALCALAFARAVSLTALVQSGVQFVAPLLVILAVHAIALGLARRPVTGFTRALYARSGATAAGLLAILLTLALVAPMPAQAGVGGLDVLGFLICISIVAIVVAGLAAAIYVLFRGVENLHRLLFGDNNKDKDTRLFEAGSLAAVVATLGLASLEGVPGAYSFDTSQTSTAQRLIDAPPAKVWDTLGTATSPAFPLAGPLRALPRPVDVEVDEGVALGATRIVRFEGREGVGHLHLQVTERTADCARFTVLSDTSPIAGWVGHKRLSYCVAPEGDQTRLTVSLDFDRHLAPAWFFRPMMQGATYLAMDVLARDVRTRAEP